MFQDPYSSLNPRMTTGTAIAEPLKVHKGMSPADADTRVQELMTATVHTVRPEDDLDRVEELMAREQIRRVPVVDGQGCCVGVVAQADLARALPEVGRKDFGKVLEKISEPAAV